MATFSIPNDKGEFSQPNKGDSQGNIHMTYGIDLNDGRISVSPQVKKLINNNDQANFSGYAGSIGAYPPLEIFAVSDMAFVTDLDDPFGVWSESTQLGVITGEEPDSGNTIMDSAYFDSLFLVSTSTDIKAWNGATWSSWWNGTLGEANLVAGDRHLLWTGPNGNLYIVDNGNKVYTVPTVGSPILTGAGTLDLSATKYEITCAVPTATRSFIGTVDLSGEEAVIAEWDMSPNATTANKFHRVGAKGVRCIAVWGETVIAILSNGVAKYFDGLSFVDFKKSTRFPVREGYELSSNFIHPNGWAIIDDMPHFLVNGRVDITNTTFAQSKQAPYQMPSGVWCLDPSIGLYHRFALGTGLSTQEDYGKMQVDDVGALYSLQNSASKFLASYEYVLDDESAVKSVLVYHDAANTKPSRGFLMTSFAHGFREMWKKVEAFHKKLVTGEKIKLYYRTEKSDVIGKSGTWATTSTFHILGTSLGIVQNDVAFIKMGNGSGQLLRVQNVSETATVTVVTFEEPNTFVTAGDLGVADFLNFRFMGEVTSTTNDYHAFTVPEQGRRRKTQFLFEFQQAAENTMELDFAIINT